MALPKVGVEAVVENANGYLKAIGKIVDANKELADSAEDTAQDFDVLNDTTEYARSVQKRYSESLKAARSALEDSSTAAGSLSVAFDSVTVAQTLAAAGAYALSAGIGAIWGAITGGISILINFGKAIFDVFFNIIGSAINAAANFAKSIVDSIGNAFNFIKDLIVDVGKRLIDFLQISVEKGMDFSKIMANIQAVTKMTGEATRNLTNELIDLGANSVAGPTAVADAYYDIASGVQDVGSQMTILKLAIATAEAGQAGLKETTQGLVTAFNAYNMGIAEVTIASDVLTRTTDLGTRTMQEYVTAIGSIAGQAAASRVKFDELGAAMAFLTTKGLTAGQASTALSGIMTQLSRNTPGVTRALKAMGEQSIEASLKNHGLAGTLKLLTEGAAKTGQNLQKLVGRVEAMKAVTQLGTDEFKEYFKTFMEGLDEATARSREIQRLDVSAQWQLFQARLEGINLSIAQALLPGINKALQFINKSFEKIDFKKIGAGLQVLGEKVGESLGRMFEGISTWLNEIDWDQVSEDVISVMTSIGDAIASIDWDTVLTQARNFVVAIGDIMSPIVNLFANVDWGKLAQDVIGVFEDTFNFIAGLDWKGMIQVIADAVAGVGEFIASIDWTAVAADVSLLITNVTNAFTTVSNFITNVDWEGLGKSASDAITTITSAIAEIDWDEVIRQATTFMQGVMQFFADLQGSFQVAGAVISVVLDGIGQAIQSVWNVIKAVKDVVIAAVSAIGGAISAALGPAAATAWNLVKALSLLGQTGGGGGGGGGGGPGGARGGTLQEGVNIVGERGAEAIIKHGKSATVISHEKTRGIMKSMNGITPLSGVSAANALANTLTNVGGVAGPGAGKVYLPPMPTPPSTGSSGGASRPAAIPYDNKWYVELMRQKRAGTAFRMAAARPAAMPISAGAGDTINNVVNKNIDSVVFNTTGDAESAVEKFARLRASGAL